ncbi:MAG TPA: hypothetical protein PLV91_05400, partial [Verrucomicrobiota bacterium]|nr:hypothetical protein [Verrucomicrobiota bacterium]
MLMRVPPARTLRQCGMRSRPPNILALGNDSARISLQQYGGNFETPHAEGYSPASGRCLRKTTCHHQKKMQSLRELFRIGRG